jgi:hypothetical protein
MLTGWPVPLQFSRAIRVCGSLKSITHLASGQLNAEVQFNWQTTEPRQRVQGGLTGNSARAILFSRTIGPSINWHIRDCSVFLLMFKLSCGL